MNAPLQAQFAGGTQGRWRVRSIAAIRGETLPAVERLAMQEGAAPAPVATWLLRGVAGHLRYTERPERVALAAVQEGLGRPTSTRAALIPIRKSAAWWALAQDERRAVFEARSGHIRDTMKYLPAIARRLHHSRDLGEPFDFLTWFEFAPEHEGRFDELLAFLRASEEWTYVEREVELRLSLD